MARVGATRLLLRESVETPVGPGGRGNAIRPFLPFPRVPPVPLFHLLAGGLILGAFYMATDLVTSPVTKSGRIIFGVGCGVLTMLIRIFGGYPEGVSFAILLMNCATPLLDRYTRPEAFGTSTLKRQEVAAK